MRNLNKHFTGILLITIAIFGILGSSPSKMTFKNGDKWIPNDFNPSKTILLVEKLSFSKRQEEKIEAYMSEKYPYKYEFVDIQTIKDKSGKYADTQLYKYALLWSSGTISMTSTPGSGGYSSGGNNTMTVASNDLYFYDRSSDKRYPLTRKACSYPKTIFEPVINTIVKKFE